jgi:transposase-like protein
VQRSTTNAIKRLHEECKRRIKIQTVLPSADSNHVLLRDTIRVR